ncbi:MAG: hypothetical protein ABJH26_02640, partial [Marinomonas sp.]
MKFGTQAMLAGAAAIGAAILAVPAFADAQPGKANADAKRTNWGTAVTRAGGGHVFGNPDAAVKIKE